ncbi:MAG TPA: tetratricopeptide repeat protein, partial [Chthonomonadaceae bacterium]|nr:tetratricopeptide repeat protein [Chthonomonadaceae bacterium]
MRRLAAAFCEAACRRWIGGGKLPSEQSGSKLPHSKGASRRTPKGLRLPSTALLLAVILGAGTLIGCPRGKQASSGLPQPGTPAYQQLVSAFYTGVIALQVGNSPNAAQSAGQIAGDNLLAATRLASQEPATWADLGLYRLQGNDLASARSCLDKAHSLAPASSPIEALLGQLEAQQGNLPAALDHYRSAVKLEPDNIPIRYALAMALKQQPDSGAEIADNLEKILQQRPENLAARVELALAAAQNGDAALLRQTLEALQASSATWPEIARPYLAAARKAAAGSDPRAAVVQVNYLLNVLTPTPAFKASAGALK